MPGQHDVETASLSHQIDAGTVAVVSPAGWQPPKELIEEVPRTVPHWALADRRIRRPWLLSWFAIGSFAIGIACGANPVGPPWSRIAFWSLSLAAIPGVVGVFTVRKDLRYVREGMVAGGRIANLDLRPGLTQHGQTMSWQHVVEVVMNLSSGDVLFWTFSGLVVSAGDREQKEIALRTGDVIPIVWLPGQFERTASPYAFLKFNHERSLTLRPETERGWAKPLMIVLSALAILAVCTIDLYLMYRCVPASFSVPVVVTIGAIGGVLGTAALLYAAFIEFKAEERHLTLRNRQALVSGGAVEHGSTHALFENTWRGWGYRLLLAMGLPVLLGGTVVLWAFGLNMLLDSEPAVVREVTVLDVHVQRGQVQAVDVTFRPVDEQNTEYSKSFAQRDRPNVALVVGVHLKVDWHSGAFGWPWVDNFQAVPVDRN